MTLKPKRLILLSNGSENLYPDNTCTHFSNFLHDHSFLDSRLDWELAVLCAGFHSHTENCGSIQGHPSAIAGEEFHRPEKRNTFFLPPATYTPESLARALHYFIFRSKSPLIRVKISKYDSETKFFRLMNFSSSRHFHLILQDHLAKALGIKEGETFLHDDVPYVKLFLPPKSDINGEPFNAKLFNYPHIFKIHLNIAGVHFCEGEYEPTVLSGCLPFENRNSYFLYHVPKPKWFRVINDDINTLNVKILGEDGLPFPLLKGHPSLLEIEFRPVKAPHFIDNVMSSSNIEHLTLSNRHSAIKNAWSSALKYPIETRKNSQIALTQITLPLHAIPNLTSEMVSSPILIFIENHNHEPLMPDRETNFLPIDEGGEERESRQDSSDEFEDYRLWYKERSRDVGRRKRKVISIHKREIPLTVGYYQSMTQVTEMLHRNTPPDMKHLIAFKTTKNNNLSIKFKASDNHSLHIAFPNVLSDFVGFEARASQNYVFQQVLGGLTFTFKQEYNLFSSYPPFILVYCSSIEYTQVAGKYAPLLKIVGLHPEKKDAFWMDSFPTLDYVKLKTGFVSSFYFELRDVSGRLIELMDNGNVTFNMMVRHLQ